MQDRDGTSRACATTPRGWLHSGEIVVGFYLDYGPGHYRSRERRACEPGNVLAVRYPAGPGNATRSRYVETVEQAREWVETGELALAV